MKAVPGGTKMGNRTFEDVKSYVEWQSQGKCTVLSAKTEQHFDDLGVDVPSGMSKPILMEIGG